MKTITIGNISAPQGTRKSGWLEICKNANGTSVSLPILIVNGTQDGPVMLMDACIHGDEYEGALVVLKIVKLLDPKKLKGTFIAVPALNPIGFDLRLRGNPWDLMYLDMNRIFPGKEDSFSLTERILYAYCNEVLLKANYVISMHDGGSLCADVPRVIIQEELGQKRLFIKESLEMAKAVAMSHKWVIAGKSEHTKRLERTSVLACAERNIPAIIIEIGGGLPWLPGWRDAETLAQVENFLVDSIQNLMKWAGMLEGKPQYPESWRKIPEYTMIRARNGGILRYNKQYRLNDSVKKGEVLATIENLLGEEIEHLKVPHDGIILTLARDITRRPSELVALIGYPPEIAHG